MLQTMKESLQPLICMAIQAALSPEWSTLFQATLSIKMLTQLRIGGSAIGRDAVCLAKLSGQDFISLHDYRGSVVSLVDVQNEHIVESIRYSAYGEEQLGEKVQETISPWRFCGNRIDKQTGWVLFKRRCYAPSLGRWTTPDPLFFTDGINRYAYVKNRPTLYIDPDGTRSARMCGSDLSKRFFNWESANFNKSRIVTIPGKSQRNLGIGFINGIWNTFEEGRNTAQVLSERAGGYQIEFCYNACHGKNDLVEASLNLQGWCTNPVVCLHQMRDRFFENAGDEGHFLQICHSQGAAHVRNGLETYDPERAARIRVVAIAPYAYIDEETCERATHYVSEADFIPLIDRENRRKYAETITYLKPHPEANRWFDHAILSPTYQKSMESEIEGFLETYGFILPR